MNKAQFNKYVSDADFRTLFNELGWDNAPKQFDTPISTDESDFEMIAVAEKRGFIVYRCEVDTIPQNALCRKIDMRLRKYSNDYIVIFHRKDSLHHLWITPVKTIDKRDLVTIEYTELSQADFLFSKLDSISFDLNEVPTIVDVTDRIHSSFEVNSGKITKDFYAGFRKEHNSFAKLIQGIDVDGDKQWYASIMLNRLMFCYFIQKKGFLNFDVNYLRNKLEWTKQQQVENTFFQSFYKGFLCALFHGGLNHPKHNAEFEKIYGRIPYLNGGMFDEHQLEKQYANIDISDDAFEQLFNFFDKWRWHLDTRITATGKDINPDVLGYIFEQYINDRAQMGAYYTKEDITEYISKNCIIPFLIDKVAATTSAKEFKKDGFVWQTLKESGDKYIYNTVKKGTEFPLPDYIEQGIDTSEPNLLERRARWNEKTSDKLGLPTEIWRETIERRQRYFEIKTKIKDGEINSINDFITYNLDIRLFVSDLLANTTDHLFVRHFYKALQDVTILDPTCGSGAFLFAALNILEPLYEVCVDRMIEFNEKNNNLFVEELQEIKNKYRSNIQYFIYKNIILRNLYGVDIMVEATEIAKLRLFLKMVAVVDVDRRSDNLGLDPLPDIDFNIRCGNTLVGYANKAELMKDLLFGDMFAQAEFEDKIDIEMQKVSMAYERFKSLQMNQQDDIHSFKMAKDELSSRLNLLNDTLNQALYNSTTTFSESHGGLTYDKWLSSHKPFHWLAEFYQIVQVNGGFDVIIGNPPYVGYTRKNKITKKAVSEIYQVKNYETLSTSNLYAFTIERSYAIMRHNAKIGMIVPISAFANNSMSQLQSFLKNNSGTTYISTYHQRPAQLFDGVLQRLSIFISDNEVTDNIIYTTGIYRWYSETRNILFKNIYYTITNQSNQQHFIKIGSDIEYSIFNKFIKNKELQSYLSNSHNLNKIYYRTAGGGYWVTFLNDNFDSDSVSNKSTSFFLEYDAKVFSAALNSNLFWWYYSINFDLFNFKDYMIFGFRLTFPDNNIENLLHGKSCEMELFLRENANYYTINSVSRGSNETVTYKKNKSKAIMDEIDKVLAKHYGFTDEELDFIINYDIKYRMGSDLENE